MKLVFPRDSVVPNQAGNFNCFIACAWGVKEFYLHKQDTTRHGQDHMRRDYDRIYHNENQGGSMVNALEMVGHLGLQTKIENLSATSLFLHLIKPLLDEGQPLVLCSERHCVVLYGYEMPDTSDTESYTVHIADPGQSGIAKSASPKKLKEWGKFLYGTRP